MEKLYAFILSSHYHIITKIDEYKYGVVDFSTNYYSEERFDTLEECLEWAEKRNYKVKSFDTYKDMFKYFMESECMLDVIDLFDVKNAIDRKAIIDNADTEKIWKEKIEINQNK